MSIVVFMFAVGTILAIMAIVGLLVWRRRQPAPGRSRPGRPTADRTLFATTYEQIGVAPPQPDPPQDERTACLPYEQLESEPTPSADATSLVNMTQMLSGPRPD
ncbi:hypothetical protein [Enhygromyxa salina]|uniref:hypothetical protein n=1 Tax=Enhygromyxa salina TaxID=215803 RepID=UPI0011BAD09C|nr:hypothetical protein [Enhygromyxa salina]